MASRLLLRALAHASGVSTASFTVGLRDGADGATQVLNITVISTESCTYDRTCFWG